MTRSWDSHYLGGGDYDSVSQLISRSLVSSTEGNKSKQDSSKPGRPALPRSNGVRKNDDHDSQNGGVVITQVTFFYSGLCLNSVDSDFSPSSRLSRDCLQPALVQHGLRILYLPGSEFSSVADIFRADVSQFQVNVHILSAWFLCSLEVIPCLKDLIDLLLGFIRRLGESCRVLWQFIFREDVTFSSQV